MIRNRKECSEKKEEKGEKRLVVSFCGLRLERRKKGKEE